MIIFILIVVGIVSVAILFSVFKERNSRRKKIIEIREKWGNPTEDERDMRLVGLYKKHSPKTDGITAATNEDIDLDELFAFADRANSKPGQQYLYKKLHEPLLDAAILAQMDVDVANLNADEAKREAIEYELAKLGNKHAYYLAELFLMEQLPLFDPLVAGYIQVSWLLIILLVVSLIFTTSPLALLSLVFIVLVNAALHYKNKGKIALYTHSLPQLPVLFDVSRWLEKNVAVNVTNNVKSSIHNLGKLKRSLFFVNFQNRVSGDPTDVLFAVFELIKTIFLLEGLMFIRSMKKVSAYREDIKTVYEYVAGIDFLITISSIRESLPNYCKPVFTNEAILDIKGLYHPLVTGCVPNSIISTNDIGALITGSNMSGKTTFIRSVVINTLFAQTIYTCCAEEYRAPLLNIHTSVRVSDDVEEHKSYFQAEALSVLDIINQCGINEPVKSLVIIDEIFRGTNTIERIAAAKSVLAYLTANHNFVFVSTHDLELAELLGDEYAVYSFEETVADQRLVFDYKLKKGILKNKNGIAILQSLGYPETVVKDAYTVSEQLRKKYQL